MGSHQNSVQALTIYECPECRRTFDFEQAHFTKDGACRSTPIPVRVFREEDVRRLWGTYHTLLNRDVVSPGTKRIIQRTLDAFPAPEDWSS